jgi:hypothetical protein
MSTLNPTRTPRDRVYGRPDQYLDVLGTPRSSGTRFLASSPNPPPKIDNWTAEFEASFKKIQDGEARYIFSAKKRANYIWYLENPTAAPRGETKKQKAKDAYGRTTCTESYELQDGQLYRKAETDERTGVTYPARYAATYSDAFENICATHESLMHFGKQYLPFFSEFDKCPSHILANGKPPTG